MRSDSSELAPPRLLTRLARTRTGLVFAVALALSAAGFFSPGLLGAGLLLIVVLGLASLLNVTWSVTPTARRVARLVVLIGVVGVAIAKVL